VRTHLWDLRSAPLLAPFVVHVERADRRALVLRVLESFAQVVSPVAHTLRMQAIMGDCNDANIIVDKTGCVAARRAAWCTLGGAARGMVYSRLPFSPPSLPSAPSGIIDFGDASRSWLVNEIAIAMAYAMITKWSASRGYLIGAFVCLRGYHKTFPLTAAEVPLLRTLVATRLAQSTTLGAYSLSKDPANEYVERTLRCCCCHY